MKGRPIHSMIRKNILEILNVMKKAYGYEIYTHYLNLFPKTHLRSIYYHLKKGVELNEIILHEIKEEKGQYSWGDKSERVYYSLGREAQIRDLKKVEKYFKAFSKNP